jgi:hypothetical protein
MNFLQHIQEIDKRIEERKEKEQQKSLFGIDDDLANEAGLSMSAGQYYRQQQWSPGFPRPR